MIKTPISIGSLNLKNRIVMAPLVSWYSDESGEVKEAHLQHYEERKGPGLVIVEATAVSPEGRLAGTQLGIFDDRQIKGLSRLAETISRNGSVPGIQIHHGGSKSSLKSNYGKLPLAVSKESVSKEKECLELSVEEIHRIQRDFARGAERAVKAGFQYIEIHGAHGYLGSQFLSPLTNKRKDGYGGSLAGRQRFLLELYKIVEKAIGGRALVSVRLGAAEKEGLTMDEGIDTAEKLKALGMSLVHISCADSKPELEETIDRDFSVLINMGALVKRETALPVIGVGDIKTPHEAELALERGLLDLVAVGRAILSDPLWAQKSLDAKEEDIHLCLSCRPCFCFKDLSLCPVRKKYKD